MAEFNAMVVHAGMRRLGAITVKDFNGQTHIVRYPKHLIEIAREGDHVSGTIDTDGGAIVIDRVVDPLGNEREYPRLQ